MVSYAYQDYFYKTNMQKDILVVDKDATVTAVSGHEPSISGATYVFTTEDFKSESFELEESLCSEEDLKFGLCEAGFVRFEVKNNPDYPNLKDREVELKVYMYFNGDSSTLFQIGTYIVEKDEYSDDRRFRNIEMYDFLFYLRDYDITPWYNNTFKNSDDIYSVKQLRDSLFDWLNSQDLGEPYSFPQETTTLVNDNFPIGRTIESDIITFDFFMQGLLELNGCMGHVDRTGQFVYKSLPWYSEEAVKVVTDDWREPPTKYEDITTIGIGFVDVYDENNILKASFGSTSFKHPSRYAIVNSFVFADKAKNDINVAFALVGLRQKITHLRYKPCEVKCQGNLCLEVGDQINVQYGTDENDNPLYFYTYILERSFKGIQSMRDVYSARGNKRQPAIKLEKNSNWQVGTSNQGTDGTGNGGVSDFKEDIDAYIIEIDRNKGFRYLDEPSNAVCEYDKANGEVKLKWTDPSDLTDSKPVPCTWAKTYVVRRESQRALNIHQGTILKTSTTRDEHSDDWFIDNTIDKNKRYYYSIMPCDTKDDVRWTKCFSVDTRESIVAPSITDIHMDSENIRNVIVEYTIPSGTYSYIKLVYKQNSIPSSYNDGTAINIQQTDTESVISGIADGDKYYFIIFTDKSVSEEKEFTTAQSYYEEYDVLDSCLTTDFTQVVSLQGNPLPASTYLEHPTEILFYDQVNRTLPILSDKVLTHSTQNVYDYGGSQISIPLDGTYEIKSISFTATLLDNTYSHCSQWCYAVMQPQDEEGTDLGGISAVWNWQGSSLSRNIQYQVETNFKRSFSDAVQNVKRINFMWSYGKWELKNIKMMAQKVS